MEKTGQRESNIELLRILAMAGIIILHFNNPDMGGGFSYAAYGSLNSFFLYFLEIIFICGVDVFLMITGYFMLKKQEVSLYKPAGLILQVVIYGIGIYLLRLILMKEDFSLAAFGNAAIPNNYFVILYVVLYLLTPYINRLTASLSEEAYRRLLILLLLLFAFYTTLINIAQNLSGQVLSGISSVGIDGDQNGYTILLFLLCYLIGGYESRKGRKKQKKLFFLLVLVWILNFVWIYVSLGMGLSSSVLNYDNPLILLEAYLSFCLFKNLKIKNNRLINELAKGAFGVYLLHMAFLMFLNVKGMAEGNPFLMLLYLFLSCLAIYLICYMADRIYHLIYDRSVGKLLNPLKKVKIKV